jgi:hypothetical protein
LTYLSYITIYQHKNIPKYLKEEKPEEFQAISKQIDTADATFIPRWSMKYNIKFEPNQA